MNTIDLERYRRMGDSGTDAIVERAWPTDKSAQEELMRNLGRWEPGSSMCLLPPEFQEFLCRPVQWPSWACPVRLGRAQVAYASRRLRARIVLAHASLPIVYLYAETSLTLTLTGQLLQHPRRRLLETIRFVEVLMTPESFENGGHGPQWVRKVRLTHALVRKTIREKMARGGGRAGVSAGRGLRSPEMAMLKVIDRNVSDAMPLDQLELAFVLQTFGWVIVDGLPRMGKAFPDEQSEEDHLHAWAMIGAALGIEQALLPASKPLARKLFEHLRSELLKGGDPLKHYKSDPLDTRLAGRLLTAALYTILVQIMRERLPSPYRNWLLRFHWLDEALQALPRTLMRRLCGVESARHLRIGPAPFLHWLIGEFALRLVDIDAVANYPLKDEPQAPATLISLPTYISQL